MAGTVVQAGRFGARKGSPIADITADEARRLWSYDPEAGDLTWRVNSACCVKAGSVARSINRNGYVVVGYGYRVWQAHRLIWLIVTGAWPKRDVDHINTDKSDNRWVNLREATDSQNRANTAARRDNRSGLKGVTLRPSGKWGARIRKDGKLHHLGTFDNPDDAHAAYVAAAGRLFGEFARAA